MKKFLTVLATVSALLVQNLPIQLTAEEIISDDPVAEAEPEPGVGSLRVYTADSGTPVNGVSYSIQDSDYNRVASFESNGGYYEIDLTEGSYTLIENAVPEGYVTLGNEAFEITADETTVISRNYRSTFVSQDEIEKYGDVETAVESTSSLKKTETTTVEENNDKSETTIEAGPKTLRKGPSLRSAGDTYTITFESGSDGSFTGGETENVVTYTTSDVPLVYYVHTSNIDDEGNDVGGGYPAYTNVDSGDITIPGASKVIVSLTYQFRYNNDYDNWVAVYDGTVTPTTSNAADSVSGALCSNSRTTRTIEVTGDTVRILFKASTNSWHYGFYAVVTGYDSNNDPITEEVGSVSSGTYEEPTPNDSDYRFEEWNTSPDGSGDTVSDPTRSLTTQTLYAQYEYDVVNSGTAGTCEWKLMSSGLLKVGTEGSTCRLPSGNSYMSYDWYSQKSSIKNVRFDGTVETNTDFIGVFDSYSNLESVDFTNVDTTLTTGSMANLFYNCSKLTSVTFPTGFGSNTNNVYAMFYRCSSLPSLIFPDGFGSSAINMYNMFNGCNNLLSVTFSSGFGSVATNMNQMFIGCNKLSELTLPANCGVSATDMGSMFSNCSALTSLTLPAGFGSVAINMSSMFSLCENLPSLTLSSGFGSAATNMSQMFNSCYALTSLTMPSGFGSLSTDMGSMFNNCSKLVSLEFPSGFGSAATNISWMFGSCSKLATVIFPDGFGASVNASRDMYVFYSCKSIKKLVLPASIGGVSGNNLSYLNLSADIELLHTKDASGTATGETTYHTGTEIMAMSVSDAAGTWEQLYSVLSRGSDFAKKIKTLANGTASYSDYNITAIVRSETPPLTPIEPYSTGDISYAQDGSIVAWYDNGTIYWYSDFEVRMNSDSNYMFEYLYSLSSIDLSGFSSANTRYMNGMFQYCTALTSVTLPSGFGSDATDMGSMFSNCSALTSLTLPAGFGGSATSMSRMFNYCTSLTSLTLPAGFGSVATDVSYIFSDCRSLASLTLPSGFGSTATNMYRVFYSCRSLSSLTLPSGCGSVATNLSEVFEYCKVLTSLSLPSGFGAVANDVSYMFHECDRITSLTLPSGFGGAATSMGYMFWGCYSLESLELPSGFGQVSSNMSNMFSNCSKLKHLVLSEYMGGASGTLVSNLAFHSDLRLSHTLDASGNPTSDDAIYTGTQMLQKTPAQLAGTWEKPTYAVTYVTGSNADRLTPLNTPQTKVYGEDLTLYDTVPGTYTTNSHQDYLEIYEDYGGTQIDGRSVYTSETRVFNHYENQDNASQTFLPGGTYKANAAITLVARYDSTQNYSSITLPAVSEVEGYHFAGYYTGNHGTGTYIGDAGDEYTPSWEDGLYLEYTEIYAHYEPNSHTFTVSNAVSGNLGSRDKEFAYHISFYETTASEQIDYTNVTATKNGVSMSFVADSYGIPFLMSAGDTVVFDGVPDGIHFTLTQQDYSAEGYTTTYEIGDSSTGAVMPQMLLMVNPVSLSVNTPTVGLSVSGTVSDNMTVSFSNTRSASVPTEVREQIPYGWIVFTGVVLVLLIRSFVRSKKRTARI